MTNREAVSRIVNSLKFTVKDMRISRRFVLRTLRNIATSLISQKLLDRTIQNDYNIYTVLNCLEFEKQDLIDCPFIQFRSCKVLMKSKKPLPKLIFSRLGSSIKDVTSIDGGFDLTVLDAQQYRRNQKRKYKINTEINIYLLPDNHLYIADKEILGVNLSFITMETDEVDSLCSCKEPNCKSGWDYEFICPDKLIEPVFKEALQTIASTYSATIIDSNPNGIDRQPTQ